jgi:hypothetical protein
MGVRNAPELVSALLRFECPESAEYALISFDLGNHPETDFWTSLSVHLPLLTPGGTNNSIFAVNTNIAPMAIRSITFPRVEVNESFFFIPYPFSLSSLGIWLYRCCLINFRFIERARAMPAKH